jgi:hypothetical protein
MLLPSTASHTVGVTGEVLCMPEAQLSVALVPVFGVVPFAPFGAL